MLPPTELFSKIDDWLKRRTGLDAPLLAIIAIFFFGMLPVASSRVIDSMNFERYYTDAAVSMLQSHDYLTPIQGEGRLRLHKPLPIYWLLIGSYKLFGVSFFSTRICFLLIACTTIWLAAKLALKLTADVRCARVTALILLSNVLFLTVAARATQDILVTFALLISGYGFIRLICLNETRASAYWSAYGGAALGVATKGVLPGLFVIYALLFAAFTSSREKPFRRVLHPGVILASTIIAASPFLLLLWKHGPPVLQSFWADQFGEKTGIRGSIFRIAEYLFIYVPFLLPWLLCLGWLFYKAKPETAISAPQRQAFRFVLIWALLLAIVFGLGDRVQDRYLAPALPLLAIVIAIQLCRFPSSSVAKVTDPLINLATIAFFAIALFGLTLLWQNGLLTKHAATLTIVLLAALLIALRLQRKQFSSAAVFSISLFLVLALCLAILSPFTLPDQTGQIARALRVLNPEKKPIYVIGTNKLASRLRISSGVAYEIHLAKRKDLLPPTSGSATNPIFILSEGEARRVNANEFQIREVAAYPIQISLRELVRKTLRGESKSYIESKCKRCYAIVAKRS